MTFALCVFCGSAAGARPEYAAAASAVGTEIGRRGWTHARLQSKPSGLLNVAGYYDALLEFIDTMARERLLHAASRAILDPDTRVTELLDRLEQAAY